MISANVTPFPAVLATFPRPAVEVTANKMGTEAVPKVMLSMGIPIILSMVLQACYNIVDSMFVARIPDSGNITNMGEYAVNALTLAFPVQML